MIAAYAGEGGQDAAGKTLQAAVHTDLALERLAEILEEEVLAQGGTDMVPGEDFVGAALAVSIETRVEPMFGKSIHPGFVFAIFLPGVERGAIFPGRVEYLTNTPVATREPGFQQGVFRVGPGQFDILIAQLALEQILLGVDLVDR